MAGGSQVSGPLLTAFAAVSGGDMARAEAAVAVRAAQLLATWRQADGPFGSLLQVRRHMQYMQQMPWYTMHA